MWVELLFAAFLGGGLVSIPWFIHTIRLTASRDWYQRSSARFLKLSNEQKELSRQTTQRLEAGTEQLQRYQELVVSLRSDILHAERRYETLQDAILFSTKDSLHQRLMIEGKVVGPPEKPKDDDGSKSLWDHIRDD